jgi:hypothetical protein
MADELLEASNDNQQWLSTIRTSSEDWNYYSSFIKTKCKCVTNDMLKFTESDKNSINLSPNSLKLNEGDELLIKNDDFPNGKFILINGKSLEQQNLSWIKSLPNKQLVMGHPLNSFNFGMGVFENIHNNVNETIDILGLTDDEISDMYVDDCVFDNDVQCIQCLGKDTGDVESYQFKITANNFSQGNNTTESFFYSFNYKKSSEEVNNEGVILKISYVECEYADVSIYIKELSDGRIKINNYNHSYISDINLLTNEWNNIILQFIDKQIILFVNNEYICNIFQNLASAYNKCDTNFTFFPLDCGENTGVPKGAKISQFESYIGTYDFTTDYEYLLRINDKIPYIEKFDISDNNLENDPENIYLVIPHTIEFSMSPDNDSIEDNYELGERESFELSNDIIEDELFYYNTLTEKFPKIEKTGKAFQTKITANKYFVLESGGVTTLD